MDPSVKWVFSNILVTVWEKESRGCEKWCVWVRAEPAVLGEGT